jgi:hypothetical protein
MEKFTVIIYKSTIAPTTISHFMNYLDAYAFVYKYVNTYFTGASLVPYHIAYRNLCYNPIPIVEIPYETLRVPFKITITRGHNILTSNDYYWNVINPDEAMILSPVGHNNRLLNNNGCSSCGEAEASIIEIKFLRSYFIFKRFTR